MNISTFVYSALFVAFIVLVLNEKRLFSGEQHHIHKISLQEFEEKGEINEQLPNHPHQATIETVTKLGLSLVRNKDTQTLWDTLSGLPELVQGEVLTRISTQLISEHHFEQVIQLLEGIEQDQRIAQGLQFLYARAQAKNNASEQAVNAYLALLNATPSHQAAAINLGILLNRQGRHELIISSLSESATLSAGRKKAKILSLLAGSYKALGKWRQAEKRYLESINYRPSHGLTWLNLARVQKAQHKDYQEVKLTYERAVALSPENHQAWMELGEIALNAGEYEAAAEALKRASVINPKHSKTRLQLAWALFETEQFSASLAEWEWLSMHGARKSYRLTAGHMQAILNDEDNHLKSLAKRLHQAPYISALQLAQKQQWPASLRALSKIMPDNPFYVRALKRQRAMFEQLKQEKNQQHIDTLIKQANLLYVETTFQVSDLQPCNKAAETDSASTQSLYVETNKLECV